VEGADHPDDVSILEDSKGHGPHTPDRGEGALAGRLRRSGVFAVAALAVLNIIDVISTTIALSLSGRDGIRLVEGNPLARLLIPNGRVEVIKVVVITALVLNTVRKPVTVGIHAALWVVVGIYAATIVNNLAAIATIG